MFLEQKEPIIAKAWIGQLKVKKDINLEKRFDVQYFRVAPDTTLQSKPEARVNKNEYVLKIAYEKDLAPLQNITELLEIDLDDRHYCISIK